MIVRDVFLPFTLVHLIGCENFGFQRFSNPLRTTQEWDTSFFHHWDPGSSLSLSSLPPFLFLSSVSLATPQDLPAPGPAGIIAAAICRDLHAALGCPSTAQDCPHPGWSPLPPASRGLARAQLCSCKSTSSMAPTILNCLTPFFPPTFVSLTGV